MSARRSSATPATAPSPFLTLPLEVRQRILYFTFDSDLASMVIPPTLHEGEAHSVITCNSDNPRSTRKSLKEKTSRSLCWDLDDLPHWARWLNKVHASFEEDLEFVEREWIVELFRLNDEREEEIRKATQQCAAMWPARNEWEGAPL
ncbi:hypothetical protein FKW77_007128 [Venturia effusa]|uniref:Uncharacterized protein n=1 Tax=Venturia effusa TaxID=50376 RepID=A0A517LJ32_9PEZI|nr:hypothetical protein FKW77_007128 [Venturia effusa]